MKGLCPECETIHKPNEQCFDDRYGFKKSTRIKRERDEEFIDMHRKLNDRQEKVDN